MKEFWNERYAQEEYAYGKAPNLFFKEQIDKLKIGRILLPADGEGRNAVYAALKGWEVVAFDISEEGKKKALKLAVDSNVKIKYLISGFEEIDFPLNSFDCVGLIYAHNISPEREKYHEKVINFLKPKGTVILEGFSKEQFGNKTGGPQDLNRLFSEEELKGDFKKLSSFEIQQTEVVLDEGLYHRGKSFVIRLVGVK